MTTGESFVNITNKSILGFDDLATRLLGYLRSLNITSVLARFDVDGAFNTKLGLASGGNDTVQVTGTSRITDGSGHVMEAHNAEGGVTALFENTSGITYYVGARYCEIATEIAINPKTGDPQYLAYTEEVGESGTPDLVTDNGNDTITFRVDSITESGVSCAGRTVRVYMVTPASGATSASIAFEDLTVVWDGSNNKVTTAGALGQTSISTTTTDYVVVMLGITVKRNTNLETSPDHMFIGTVLGVGAGSPPATFDVSGQRLLKTFEDASQILFTPYGFISSTNVQEAIQEVLDTYADEGTSANGATFIGVNVTTFLDAAPSADSSGYGIGNISDGTFTTDRDLQLILERIDNRLATRRAWSATYANGITKTTADVVGSQVATNAISTTWATLWSSAKGGTAFIQDGDYGSTLDGATGSAYPWVVGETGAWGATGVYPRFRLGATITADLAPKGDFWRLHFDSADDTYAWLFGPSVRLRDVALQIGQAKFNCYVGTDSLYCGPLVDGAKIKDFNTLTNINDSGVEIYGVGAGSNTKDLGVFENMHVKTDDSPALVVSNLGARPGSNAVAAVTFRNCTFMTTSTADYVAEIDDSDVVFENCIFEGVASSTVYAVIASGTGRVWFKNCKIIAKELQAIQFTAAGGGLEGCEIYSGTGTTVTNPKCVDIRGGAQTVHVRDLNVLLEGSRGESGDTPSSGLVQLGLGVGHLVVDGLTVRYESGVKIHKWDTITLYGSVTSIADYGPVHSVSNVTLDLSGVDYTNPIQCDVIYLQGWGDTYPRIAGRNIQVVGIDDQVYNGATKPVLLNIGDADVIGVHFHVGSGSTGSGEWGAFLYMDTNANVRDVSVFIDATGNTGDLCDYIIQIAGDNCRLDGVVLDITNATIAAIIQVDGSMCQIGGINVKAYPPASVLINNNTGADQNVYNGVMFVDFTFTPTAAAMFGSAGYDTYASNIFLNVGTNSTTVAMLNFVGTRSVLNMANIRGTGGTSIVNSGASSITGDEVINT